VAVVLGACVALVYGSADFLGGVSSQRTPTATVVFGSQTCGLVLAVGFVAALRDPAPGARPLLLSATAGLVGMTAVGLLYRGLAVGRMSVVAPLSAVGGGVLPFAWGLVRGERPSPWAMAGALLALVAVVIVARGAEHDPSSAVSPRSELAFGCGAGAGFGVVFILFAESSAGSGMWPLLAARMASVPALLVLVLALRRPLLPHRHDAAPVAAAGVLDLSANALILLAVRRGLISLVAPVAALYPAATVLLARLVLREPLGRTRLGGLALALAGLVLIAAR
jgi:uncharacterized membrane protein